MERCLIWMRNLDKGKIRENMIEFLMILQRNVKDSCKYRITNEDLPRIGRKHGLWNNVRKGEQT